MPRHPLPPSVKPEGQQAPPQDESREGVAHNSAHKHEGGGGEVASGTPPPSFPETPQGGMREGLPGTVARPATHESNGICGFLFLTVAKGSSGRTSKPGLCRTRHWAAGGRGWWQWWLQQMRHPRRQRQRRRAIDTDGGMERDRHRRLSLSLSLRLSISLALSPLTRSIRLPIAAPPAISEAVGQEADEA